jgi:hypothetical protein
MAPAASHRISGWGSQTDVAKSRAVGFSAHLLKPIGPELLEGVLVRTAEAIHEKKRRQ